MENALHSGRRGTHSGTSPNLLIAMLTAQKDPQTLVPAKAGRLKICIVSWAPFLAGAEIAAERLALGLQSVGHDVLVVAGTEGPALDHFRNAGLRCVFSPIHFTDKWHWWRYRKARS